MKNLLLSVLATSLVLSASAAVPFEKGKTNSIPVRKTYRSAPSVSPPMSRAVEEKVLLDENFDKFSDGTETEPGAEIVYENGYYIPASYTSEPGWTGQGLRPAGGCVSLHPWVSSYEETRGGYISTPRMMLDGTATLTFRAKALGSETALLWVALCDDNYGPGESFDAELTNEWKEFSFVASEGSVDDPSYFQMMADEGLALVDDVKLVFRQDRVGKPYALPALNVSPNEFVARWEGVNNVDGYLLTVLCTSAPESPVIGELTESFDGIKVNADGKTIDRDAPGYPDGWTISVTEHGSQDVTTDPADLGSAPVALVFDEVGDMIESPATPEPIDRLSFWCKPSKYTDNWEYMSLIRLEIYHSLTDTWENVGHLGYFNFMEQGGEYTLNAEALGKDATRMRLSFIQRSDVDFYIDDIRMHYTSRGTTAPLFEDKVVKDTEYAVKDINPRNEYTYYVKAFRDDIVSAASYAVWVDGVAGLKVETEEATDVTETSFTANWKQLGHAKEYSVNTYCVIAPEADMEDVVVLEETFDKIDEGTVENPGQDWVSPFDFGTKGWAATGWCATQPAWAKGMAGTTGTNVWMGVAGLVYTPVLDLSCYDGKGIKVDATFVTTVDAFDYNGTDEPEGVFAILMNSSDLNTPIASGLLDTPKAGSTSGLITINNVPEDADLSSVVIAFMNKSGLTFFVDYAKISMNVPAGETLMTPLGTVATAETSYRFDGLDPRFDHAFAVKASTSHSFETFVSEMSEMRHVKTSTAGVTEITIGQESGVAITTMPGAILVDAPEGVRTEVYTPAGLRVAVGEGCCTLEVAAGVYIVRAAGHTVKVAVS